MDFKKVLLQKLSKDTLYPDGKKKFSANVTNEDLLQLDFNSSREQVLNNFNEILNTFRFILIYDQLKVDPNKEFNYDEITKMITNSKYDLKSLPYYKEIADLMDNFDVSALKTLKSTLDSLNIQTADLQNQEAFIQSQSQAQGNVSYDAGIGDGSDENKSVAMLEEINKEFNDTLNYLDAKILAMKDKIDDINKKNMDDTKKAEEVFDYNKEFSDLIKELGL